LFHGGVGGAVTRSIVVVVVEAVVVVSTPVQWARGIDG
jgi:hypothetical protein